MTEHSTTRYVVDASVAIKWFLDEVHSEAAARLLLPRYELLAPDLIFPEIGNILWKRQRAGEITTEEATDILSTFSRVTIQITLSKSVMALALDIACSSGRTAYDSLYVALAIQERALLVTADRRLYNALHGGSLTAHICWVEDDI